MPANVWQSKEKQRMAKGEECVVASHGSEYFRTDYIPLRCASQEFYALYGTKDRKGNRYYILLWHRLPVGSGPAYDSSWLRQLAPALLVLLVTYLYSLPSANPSLMEALKTLGVVALRFARITVPLCLCLLAVIPVYAFVAGKKRPNLLHIEQAGMPAVHARTHWVLRPLQGIGINFLFSTKLIALLQLVTHSASPLIPPQGQFYLWRLILVTGINVFAGLLLSSLWTFDDMGIRYFNRRDHEVKKMGKFVGTLMPILFGSYGIFALFSSYPTEQALAHVLRIMAILYPPYTLLALIHTHLIIRKRSELFRMTKLRKGSVEVRD